MVKVNSFPTQFRKYLRVTSEPGVTEKVVYKSQYNDDGVLEIVPAGKENMTDFIQSHADSVDIHVLLRRYKNGEISDFERVSGIYGDFVKAPRTYAEMLNTVIQGQQLFESLPVEERAKFNHNYAEFISSFDTPKFYEAMQVSGFAEKAPVAVEVQEPVKNMESEVKVSE
jgi:hypothetical protein